MKIKTLTKLEIARAINENLGFSKEESKRFVNFLISKIIVKLSDGDIIKIVAGS